VARGLVDEALSKLSPDLPEAVLAHGRPSIPPEWLMILQVLYSIRSERPLLEQPDR
jgi:hypothetical protein